MDTKDKGKGRITASYEVWTQLGAGQVYLRPFKGCEMTIDLGRYAFKTEAEAAAFVCKLIQDSAWDTMILAGLAPQRRES